MKHFLCFMSAADVFPVQQNNEEPTYPPYWKDTKITYPVHQYQLHHDVLIRAKRVSNWYIPKKKSARVHVRTCARVHVSNNLGFSVRISYQLGSQDTYM